MPLPSLPSPSTSLAGLFARSGTSLQLPSVTQTPPFTGMVDEKEVEPKGQAVVSSDDDDGFTDVELVREEEWQTPTPATGTRRRVAAKVTPTHSVGSNAASEAGSSSRLMCSRRTRRRWTTSTVRELVVGGSLGGVGPRGAVHVCPMVRVTPVRCFLY